MQYKNIISNTIIILKVTLVLLVMALFPFRKLHDEVIR